MGVLNVTPDSFSDGGKYLQPEKAYEHFNYLLNGGADLIEIGAESSRPGATLIGEDEEWFRLEKILQAIAPRKQKIAISLDTRKANIAMKALTHGVKIINDVSALDETAYDNGELQNLAKVIAQFPSSYIVLNHHRGIPPSFINPPANPNLMEEVKAFFEERIQRAQVQGVKKSQIILDPGLGFGKGLEENIRLIHALNELKIHFQMPIMVGPSRKRFVTELWGEAHRDTGSVAISLLAAINGANIIRCHEPKLHKPIHKVKFISKQRLKEKANLVEL